METSSCSVNSGLFKSWSLGLGWGQNGVSNFYIGIYWIFFLIFLSKTICILRFKFVQIMTLGTGWVCNGWVQFYIGIYWAKSLKIFSETDRPQKAKTSVEASSGRVDYHLFKSWSPGIGWSHNGDPIFTYEFIEYNLQMSSSSKKKHLKCLEKR